MNWIKENIDNIVIGSFLGSLNALILGRIGFFGYGKTIELNEQTYNVKISDLTLYTRVYILHGSNVCRDANGELIPVEPTIIYRIRPFQIVETKKGIVTDVR